MCACAFYLSGSLLLSFFSPHLCETGTIISTIQCGHGYGLAEAGLLSCYGLVGFSSLIELAVKMTWKCPLA